MASDSDLSIVKSASDKVRENLNLASKMGRADPSAIRDIGIGYLVGAAEWLEAAMGPQATAEQLYRLADFVAGRIADARGAQTG